MATNFVGGVQKIRVAPAVQTEGAITTGLASAIEIEFIAMDTVQYTENSDTTEDLKAEDKDYTILSFQTDGDPDQIVISVLQQKPEVLAMFENIVYTPATTKIVGLAKRKVADVMFEITTRSMKDNRKQVIVLPNVSVVKSTDGNLTKNGVQRMVLTGKVGAFKTTTGNLDAKYIKTWVTDAGAPIDSTIV
ncbi:MAG: hypothetical protein EOO95_02255 [Pedobacter sp.]|nr:MAG: hypothetical protein EOO95_02255 [Pedobacter sp.]